MDTQENKDSVEDAVQKTASSSHEADTPTASNVRTDEDERNSFWYAVSYIGGVLSPLHNVRSFYKPDNIKAALEDGEASGWWKRICATLEQPEHNDAKEDAWYLQRLRLEFDKRLEKACNEARRGPIFFAAMYEANDAAKAWIDAMRTIANKYGNPVLVAYDSIVADESSKHIDQPAPTKPKRKAGAPAKTYLHEDYRQLIDQYNKRPKEQPKKEFCIQNECDSVKLDRALAWGRYQKSKKGKKRST